MRTITVLISVNIQWWKVIKYIYSGTVPPKRHFYSKILIWFHLYNCEALWIGKMNSRLQIVTKCIYSSIQNCRTILMYLYFTWDFPFNATLYPHFTLIQVVNIVLLLFHYFYFTTLVSLLRRLSSITQNLIRTENLILAENKSWLIPEVNQ